MFSPGGSEVGPDDSEVVGKEIAYGLQLDHPLIVHQQVQPVQTDLNTPTDDGNGLLSDKGDISLTELHDEGRLVDSLQKTRPQFSVDLDGSSAAPVPANRYPEGLEKERSSLPSPEMSKMFCT